MIVMSNASDPMPFMIQNFQTASDESQKLQLRLKYKSQTGKTASDQASEKPQMASDGLNKRMAFLEAPNDQDMASDAHLSNNQLQAKRPRGQAYIIDNLEQH